MNQQVDNELGGYQNGICRFCNATMQAGVSHHCCHHNTGMDTELTKDITEAWDRAAMAKGTGKLTLVGGPPKTVKSINEIHCSDETAKRMMDAYTVAVRELSNLNHPFRTMSIEECMNASREGFKAAYRVAMIASGNITVAE